MTTTIEQQTALDESLVPSSQRLRIGRCNFRLPSDIQSEEATLQVVYDVLRNSPLFRAFQVTADEECSRFGIFSRNAAYKPQILNQQFADLPTEEEVLDFLRFLGHSQDIRYLTDVNVNKLYQPWRSFASVINKCLTGKSSGEDFVYQVEHKSQKRSNEMNYPRFTKVIIDYFMTRKPSISRRNRIHWHYVRDDALFSTIKVVSRHQAIQQYGAILPIKLTTAAIRNNKAYQEYYACAMGEAAPKPKASARKKKGDSASSTTTPTPTPTTTTESAPRLSVSSKEKQPLRATTLVEPTDLQAMMLERPEVKVKKKKKQVKRKSKAYQEFYACAMGEAALKPKASARKKKGKRPLRATTPVEPTDLQRTEAEQLKIVLKRSRQETHISQQSWSGTDEGTGSKPGVPDVPSDDSEEELSWKSFDDEEVG
nr:hypothetical protein [Tanacetum cinerariifolium]